MPFTDRFIKLPAKLYSEYIKDLTDKEQCEDCTISLLPFEIYEYHEMEDDNEVPGVLIYLRSGESFMIYLSLADFEKALNNHFKTQI